MKRISFSSILLFPLAIFFIMQNRLSPGDTPYALFGIIFILLFSYVLADFLPIKQSVYAIVKNILLVTNITVILGACFISVMIVRHQTAPIYGVHDIILQQEAAIRYFIHGKNPYQETYFGTPMQAWHYSDTEVNPALYHFVMEPLYLLFPIPFYTLSNHIIGYFDSREVLWLLFAGTLILAYLIPKDEENKRILVTLMAFNPAMLSYVVEGRSDFFAYFFLLFGFFLLERKKLFLSGLLIAASFLVKQSSWPLLPFYLLYLLKMSYMENKIFSKQLMFFVKNISGFVLLLIGMSVPFFLWNQKAFLDSTVFYLSGNIVHSYPISGYGFGMVLNQLGFIKNVNQYYPFQIWQAFIGLPILIFLLFQLWKSPNVQKLIFFYAIFLFVFWYFSRYFNNSHVGYISTVIITAYLWPQERSQA